MIHAGFLIRYFSTLKIEAISSSENLVNYQQTTWCSTAAVLQTSYMLHAGSLIHLFFDPEDRGDIFLRKFS
jgi:hypothetical protein